MLLEIRQTKQELKSGLYYNHQRYMTVGLSWENVIVLVHYIYLWCKVYMSSVALLLIEVKQKDCMVKSFVNSYQGLYWYNIIFVLCKNKKKIRQRMRYYFRTTKLENV